MTGRQATWHKQRHPLPYLPGVAFSLLSELFFELDPDPTSPTPAIQCCLCKARAFAWDAIDPTWAIAIVDGRFAFICNNHLPARKREWPVHLAELLNQITTSVKNTARAAERYRNQSSGSVPL